MQLRVGPWAGGSGRRALVLGFCGLLAGCDWLGAWGFDRRYTVSVAIDRAPGPFGQVTWHADYRATGCPARGSTAGDRSVPLAVHQKSDHEYEATVPTRPAAGPGAAPQEQDPCRWQLVSTSARFSATDAEGDEVYEARLTAEQLAKGRPVVLYYWRGSYPRMPGAISTRSLGEPDRQVFRPQYQNQLFTTTVTPQEAP